MNNLTPKQVKAIPLMAQGKLGVDVAKEIGVTPQTISEWKKSEVFNKAVDSFRSNSLKEAEKVLSSLSLKSVNVLGEILETSSNDSIRLKVAIFIIDKLDIQGYFPSDSDKPKSVDMDNLLRSLGVS